MKVVYDTCLYIEMLRTAKHLELFTSRHAIRYLSPIVLMELQSGARTASQQKILSKLFKPYSTANRIIGLNASQYAMAGEVLSKLHPQKNDITTGLSHDVLIALSAKSIGATLFTSNKKDFEKIRTKLDFRLELV